MYFLHRSEYFFMVSQRDFYTAFICRSSTVSQSTPLTSIYCTEQNNGGRVGRVENLSVTHPSDLGLQTVRIPHTESGAGLVPEARLFVLVTHLAEFLSPGRGVVLGRAAITLRSIETQGCFSGTVGQRKKASDKKRQNLKFLHSRLHQTVDMTSLWAWWQSCTRIISRKT